MSKKQKTELWTVEPRIVKVADLIPYVNNVRDNNDEAVEGVVQSLIRHGYQERILITEDNIIVRGHTRVKAFKKLGWEEVEALVAVGSKGWTNEQIDLCRLTDNRTQELSQVKPKELDLELREFADVEYAKSLGFVETKPFAEGTFGTSQSDIDRVEKQLEEGFEEREVAKQDGMVKLPCPHCQAIFMMRLKDLENKVKYKIKEMNYDE